MNKGILNYWGIDFSKCLKFDLLDGEYFTHIIPPINGMIYLRTNLGRVWVSTDVKFEYLDFVEITDLIRELEKEMRRNE